MNMKHKLRGLLLFLSLFPALFLGLFPETEGGILSILLPVSAEAAVSSASGFEISVEPGDMNILRSSLHVPVTITVTNQTPEEVRGTLELTMTSVDGESILDSELHPIYHLLVQEEDPYQGKNCVYKTSWQVTIPSMETISVTTDTSIPSPNGVLRLELKDGKGNILSEKSRTCSTQSLLEDYLFVGIFSEDEAVTDLKEGARILLNDTYYKVHLVRMTPETMKTRLARSNPELLLIGADYYRLLSDAELAELENWQMQGGVVRMEEHFSAETIAACVHEPEALDRIYFMQQEEFIRSEYIEQLEASELHEKAKAFLCIGILVLFSLAIGPSFWNYLRRRNLQSRYWKLTAMTSLLAGGVFFALSLFLAPGAPKILFLNTISQTGGQIREDMIFGLEMPYQDPVTLYTAPEIQLTPLIYGWDASAQYQKRAENYYQEAEQLRISYAPSQTEIKVKNQTAYARDYFELHTGWKENEAGLFEGSLVLKQQEMTVEGANKTPYSFSGGAILTPAGYYLTGPIEAGQSFSIRNQDLYSYQMLAEGLPEGMTQELAGFIYVFKETSLMNREYSFRFVGEISDYVPDYWMNSGYERKGHSFYQCNLTLEKDEEGWIDSNWAGAYYEIPGVTQNVSLFQGVENLLLSEVQTDVIYHLEYAYPEETVFDSIGFYEAEDQQSSFRGNIELYNVTTEQYEPYDWSGERMLKHAENYIRNGQLRVRFEKTDELEDSFVYAPVLWIREKGGEHA